MIFLRRLVPLCGSVWILIGSVYAGIPEGLSSLIQQSCLECHDTETAEGGLDLSLLSFELSDRWVRDRWIHIHDRVQKGEMPPQDQALLPPEQSHFLNLLATEIGHVDHEEILTEGRGPLRRLNRDEYEQNLRDVLQLPTLDIRDMLPEDRQGHRFQKTSATLDMSRVQLTAYLDAAETALRQAMIHTDKPPPVTAFRAIGTALFPEDHTFGEREAMFFAKDNTAIDSQHLDALREDPAIELAIFRSAHWPYYGYPKGFVAQLPGEYKVRFSARAVVQMQKYTLMPATRSVPMTFRARKPSGPDVSGDVRATGGLIDIQPEVATYETTVLLREHETFEYSLLGLPVPLARNINGGGPEYRYPPLPEGGQPGIAFQWLEVEGPVASNTWPPPSHCVLFDTLGAHPTSKQPLEDAKRLLRRFIAQAGGEALSEESLHHFDRLIQSRLEHNVPFAESMLAGYKAFLCSGHFLYLHEPTHASDHLAIASRLSHFLTNTRPDVGLLEQVRLEKLRDAKTLQSETLRLISSDGFDRFVKHFTDSWLNLCHVRRDEPDIRLYPEYRFDDYLVESMERETRAFFAAMIRDNLSVASLIDTDFVFANDRLASHYQLSPINGFAMRKVTLPKDSPRGGLLTQAALLKVTSNGTSTSPVVRGAWVMERLLGEPPPPPPTSVPAVEPDIQGAKTIRELLSLHTASQVCANCHAQFDPVGLALENFDILGGWRTVYRGVEQGERVFGIDRAGHDFSYTLTGPVDASGTLRDGRPFHDIRDLKTFFAARPRQLARNLLHLFTVYSTGTPVRFSDRIELEALLDSCSVDGYRVRDLLLALVQSKIFLGQDGCL